MSHMVSGEVSIGESKSLVDIILGIVPSNPIKAFADGEMLQIIFFAMITGIAMSIVGKKAEPVRVIFESLNEICMKMVGIIMLFAPYGVFALVCDTFSSVGQDAILVLIKYIAVVLLGMGIHIICVYGGMFKLFTKEKIMPFLKKYIISIRTRLYGLLLFLSVLQFIIYTCDIYTNYVYSFIFENVYIPQSFRLYSHLMYFLLGVCLRLYLTDNNMLKNVIGGGKAVLCYIIYILCAALICYLLYRNVGAIEYFQNSIICVLASLSFFLSLRSIVFSGYIGRTIVNLSSCSILVYTIHYPILSLLYMKTDLFVHTDFSFLAWAGLLLLWFFISYWVYQIPYISSFLRI